MGNAWVIEVDDSKNVKAKRFQPSKFSYKVIEADLRSMVDIDILKNQLLNCDKKNTAVRLNLTGILVDSEIDALNAFFKECADKTNGFIHFEGNKFIKRKIDIGAINDGFVNDSLPHILLTELLNEDPDGLSTQIAFEAIEKNK
mgnify:FL=1|jgi:hypothetical protein